MTRREMWQALLDKQSVTHEHLASVQMTSIALPLVMCDNGKIRYKDGQYFKLPDPEQFYAAIFDEGWEICYPICTREQAIEGLKRGEKWKALDCDIEEYKYTELGVSGRLLNHYADISYYETTYISLLSCNRWQRVYDKGETQ